MTIQTRRLGESPDETVLARLRVLESKMGVVLTLVCIICDDEKTRTMLIISQFKASVWGVINEQPAMDHDNTYSTADSTA